MNFSVYRDLLSIVPVRRVLLVGMLARFPHAAAGVLLTLHVVLTLDKGYAAAGVVAALVTIGIAVPGMMKTENLLIPILSMVIGTFIGELIDIDGALQKLSNNLQSKFKGSSVAEGFFTCSLVFAVGAVAVMGAP